RMCDAALSLGRSRHARGSLPGWLQKQDAPNTDAQRQLASFERRRGLFPRPLPLDTSHHTKTEVKLSFLSSTHVFKILKCSTTAISLILFVCVIYFSCRISTSASSTAECLV